MDDLYCDLNVDGTARCDPGGVTVGRWKSTTCWQTGHKNRHSGPYEICQVEALIGGRLYTGRRNERGDTAVLRPMGRLNKMLRMREWQGAA